MNTINIELKKAIVNFMFDNRTNFQLQNATTEHFRQYIFTPTGDYCIGGDQVSAFISMAIKLIND